MKISMEGTRAADRRIQLVGSRKSGYCGHVPQYVYFKQEQKNDSPKARNVSPLRDGNPANPSRASSVPLRQGSASRLSTTEDGVPKPTRDGPRRNAAEYYADPPIQMFPFKKREHPPAPKFITGFGGHRAGHQFATGCTVNGPRKSEMLPKALEQQLVFPQLGKPTPLPRYPVIRGPTRMSPLGHEMFLTN